MISYESVYIFTDSKKKTCTQKQDKILSRKKELLIIGQRRQHKIKFGVYAGISKQL